MSQHCPHLRSERQQSQDFPRLSKTCQGQLRVITRLLTFRTFNHTLHTPYYHILLGSNIAESCCSVTIRIRHDGQQQIPSDVSSEPPSSKVPYLHNQGPRVRNHLSWKRADARMSPAPQLRHIPRHSRHNPTTAEAQIDVCAFPS